MNKKVGVIIGVVVVFVVVILGILLSQDNTAQNGNNTIEPTITQGIQPGKSQTYQEFLRSGRSEICTFSTNVEGSITNGTVYAANGKIRSDFAITGSKGTLQQHFLVDSYMAYLWNNINNAGIKFAVTENGANAPFGSKLNVNCTDWAPNNSVFDIPSNITFTEISQTSEQKVLQILSPTTAPTGQ